MSQQPAALYLRQGQIPFFRLPMAPAGFGDPACYAGADAVLLGVPWDGGTTYQPGARLAPWDVRRVSALVQSFHPVHRVDVFGALRALDGGNVALSPFDGVAMRERVHGEVAAVLTAGAAPFVVGGDHSVALPALRAIVARHGPVAVVHVDAHADTSTGELWGDDFHHGAPLRHALAEGLVQPGQLYQIGLRGPQGGPDDGAFAAAHGAHVFRMEAIEARGIAFVMAEVRERIGDRPVYLTFDIDGIDPAFAPGTGTPVPGGLTSREALALVRGLAGVRLVGMDLVEVAPALDHADMTSHLAAALLYEGLALLALRA